MYRSVPRYLAAKAVAGRAPGLLAGPVAPLRLAYRPEPSRPGDGWVRVRPRLSGICGSDLGVISGSSSFYFSALVSLPFVPGHEVVGETLDPIDGLPAGSRVILDPVLSCEPRGIEPPCPPCASGNPGLCERITGGRVGPGLQTGYCADTSGGWSELLIAHRSQLHEPPEEISDEAAVMVEPLACALHSVTRTGIAPDATVLVVGAGTVGLLTIAALRHDGAAGRVIAVAKHPQQRELARVFGATSVVSSSEAITAIRRQTRAFRADPERSDPFLLGGADVAFDCVGAPSSLGLALRATRARGKVVLSGMPSGADLSPAWFRELEVVGSYSGSGSFQEAISLAAELEVGKLVSASYPLSAWREAIGHAFEAGSLGATKIVFDPRLDQ